MKLVLRNTGHLFLHRASADMDIILPGLKRRADVAMPRNVRVRGRNQFVV